MQAGSTGNAGATVLMTKPFGNRSDGVGCNKRFSATGWYSTVNGNKLPFFYHEEHKGCTKDTKPCACVSLCSLWLTKLRQTKNDIFMPFTVYHMGIRSGISLNSLSNGSRLLRFSSSLVFRSKALHRRHHKATRRTTDGRSSRSLGGALVDRTFHTWHLGSNGDSGWS